MASTKFKYLVSVLTNDGRCTCEIKTKIAMAKAAFNKKKTLSTSTLDLTLRKKLVKCYIWSMALYGAETWMLQAADQKYLESFEMWCWKRMEISWTDHVRSEKVLLRVNEQRNILNEIRKWKANWIGHILRRTCLLSQVIEGKIKGEMEVTRRRGRRCRKLLDDLKDRRGYSHFKGGRSRLHCVEESFWRRLWTCHQIEYWMNEYELCLPIDWKPSYFIYFLSVNIHWSKNIFWQKLCCLCSMFFQCVHNSY